MANLKLYNDEAQVVCELTVSGLDVQARVLNRDHYYALELTTEELAAAVMAYCNARDKRACFVGARIPRFITIVGPENTFRVTGGNN